MIAIDDIYAKTRGGLDIILRYYPQAAETLSSKTKHFKLRADERTPSATLKEINGIWRVTDFGSDGRAQSPIDICIKEEKITFNEAIYHLARMFNIDGQTITPEINKPEIRTRPATDSEPDGHFTFIENPQFSPDELSLLGPRITQEHCNRVGYKSIKQYSITRDRKTTTIISNTKYPIFLRKCPVVSADGKSTDHFYKIYQPLNPDKSYRFFYKGTKPEKYINGQFELKKAFEKLNRNNDATLLSDNNVSTSGVPLSDGEEKKVDIEKFSNVVIVSGERDALCALALGYMPLWFNSETYNFAEFEYLDILKYADKIYCIPDIDETGRRRGLELSRKFPDIFMIWLPDELQTHRDRRGNPRKDFRDFCEIHPDPQNFKKLINLATPYRFWELRKNTKGIRRFEIMPDYALYFLQCNGFRCIEDKNSPTGRMFVRIDNHIIRTVYPDDMCDKFYSFACERGLDVDIRNLALSSTKLSEPLLRKLGKINIDFTRHTATSQFFFFRNAIWEATTKNIIEHSINKSNMHVWETELLDKSVKRLTPAINITRIDNENSKPTWNINIPQKIESNLFKFLINSSRIHWRKELEYEGPDMTPEQQTEYRKKHKFSIDGPLLSAEEIAEQKQHLINKIFVLGYLLHNFKAEERPWCVFAMDSKDVDSKESSGGTGKSFFCKLPCFFMQYVRLSGRNSKLTDNKHIFENVTEHTRYIRIDDADRYTDFNFFFDAVTEDITVNPKNQRSFSIPFEKSPKFCISSNYTLRKDDGSTTRRILYAVFSDYYHQKTNKNDYQETRTIFNDFGKRLFRDDYTESEWNADINFMVECCQFYLSTIHLGTQIQAPMDNVIKRSQRDAMAEGFLDWARGYFSPQSGTLDKLISKQTAYIDYKNETGKTISSHSFKASLELFCKYEDYIITLNPIELINDKRNAEDKGRIRIWNSSIFKNEEMIYIQTQPEINKEVKKNITTSTNENNKPEETESNNNNNNKLPF